MRNRLAGACTWSLALLAAGAVQSPAATGDFPKITEQVFENYEVWHSYQEPTQKVTGYVPGAHGFLRNQWENPCNDMVPMKDSSWSVSGKYSLHESYNVQPCGAQLFQEPSLSVNVPSSVPSVRYAISSHHWYPAGTLSGKRPAFSGMSCIIKPDGMGRQFEYALYMGHVPVPFTPTGTDPVKVFMPWEMFAPTDINNTFEEAWWVAGNPYGKGYFNLDDQACYKADVNFPAVTVILAKKCTAPIRIDAGNLKSDYTDSLGQKWRPDVGFSETVKGLYFKQVAVDSSREVAGTKAPKVYNSYRIAPAACYIPIDQGIYRVVLHFAEIDKNITAAGQRVFSVRVNDQTIPSLDIFKESGGSARALTKSVDAIVPDSMLNIVFTKVSGAAPIISGIEVLGAMPNRAAPRGSAQAVASRPLRGAAGPWFTVCGRSCRADERTGARAVRIAAPGHARAAGVLVVHGR